MDIEATAFAYFHFALLFHIVRRRRPLPPSLSAVAVVWIWIIVARSRRLSQRRVVALYGRAESRHLKVDTVSD